MVMLSIKPKWCKLIISGKKTIEVRKTRPKLLPPFKCCVYCCKPVGKVIGEFICDKITLYPYETNNDGEHFIPYNDFEQIGMDGIELFDYLLFNDSYGWHISNFKLYNEPKELSEFNLSRPPQSWCYIKEKN